MNSVGVKVRECNNILPDIETATYLCIKTTQSLALPNPHYDVNIMINDVIKLGSDMNENVQDPKEKRMGWMNDRVVNNIVSRMPANINYRRTRMLVGVNHYRAKEEKEIYERYVRKKRGCVPRMLCMYTVCSANAWNNKN